MTSIVSKRTFLLAIVAGIVTCACSGSPFSDGSADVPDASSAGTQATSRASTSLGGTTATSTAGQTSVATGGVEPTGTFPSTTL